ncbi:MAG: hypothetical protein MUO21_07385, partial [Nitrososphaeraceae archaeon]|nr:hypothetical protein [Nitrososphaeraceae archaeon]
IKKPEGSSVKAFTIGAPRYRLEVTAENYKDAENLLERYVEVVLKAVKAEGGEGKPIQRITKEA